MKRKETLSGFDEKQERLYFSKLMKRVFTKSELTSEDLSALVNLSLGLERFLKNSDDKERAANNLLADLKKIAAEGIVVNTIGEKKRSPDFITTGTKLIAKDGKYLWLGKQIGSGGEGAVFNIPSMPGKAAKVFGNNVDLKYEEKHVKAIIRNSIPSMIDGTMVATVPETLLYNEQGRFAGFIMNKVISQTPIHMVMRSFASDKKIGYLPSLDYKGMIALAYNLAEIVDCMHKHNVIIGDLNTNNIIVNYDGTLCLIDVNSFDITDPVSGEHFPCKVGIPEMLAPELQRSGYLKNSTFTKQSDLFSLAIIIFRLLMNNSDPFGAKETERTQSSSRLYTASHAIINGDCVYFRKVEGKTIPDHSLPLEFLPEDIRRLFARVFCYSAENYISKISDRPTAEEWMNALMEYLQSPIIHCDSNAFHWYRKEMKTCPFCEIDKKKRSVYDKKVQSFNDNSMNTETTLAISVGLK